MPSSAAWLAPFQLPVFIRWLTAPCAAPVAPPTTIPIAAPFAAPTAIAATAVHEPAVATVTAATTATAATIATAAIVFFSQLQSSPVLSLYGVASRKGADIGNRCIS